MKFYIAKGKCSFRRFCYSLLASCREYAQISRWTRLFFGKTLFFSTSHHPFAGWILFSKNDQSHLISNLYEIFQNMIFSAKEKACPAFFQTGPLFYSFERGLLHFTLYSSSSSVSRSDDSSLSSESSRSESESPRSESESSSVPSWSLSFSFSEACSSLALSNVSSDFLK